MTTSLILFASQALGFPSHETQTPAACDMTHAALVGADLKCLANWSLRLCPLAVPLEEEETLSSVNTRNQRSFRHATAEGMWHVGLLGNLTSLSLVHVPVTNKGLALLADDASPICKYVGQSTLPCDTLGLERSVHNLSHFSHVAQTGNVKLARSSTLGDSDCHANTS